jgi:hypothetical protein
MQFAEKREPLKIITLKYKNKSDLKVGMARPTNPNSLYFKIKTTLERVPNVTSKECSKLLELPYTPSFINTFSSAKSNITKAKQKEQGFIDRVVTPEPSKIRIVPNKPVEAKPENKEIKFVAIGDPHSIHCNPQVLKQVLAFIDDYKPDLLVHLGDNWDFASLRGTASPEERAQSLLEDYAVGEDIMRKLFKGRDCEKVFLWGNHDDRILQGLHKLDGPKKDLCELIYKKQQALFKECGCVDIKFDALNGVFKKGPVSFVHGYYHCMNTAKAHAEFYGTVLAGDMHSIQYWRLTKKERTEGFHVGCLCDKNPDYMTRLSGRARWEHGFAYGVITPDFYEVHQAKMAPNGNFYLPEGIKKYE